METKCRRHRSLQPVAEERERRHHRTTTRPTILAPRRGATSFFSHPNPEDAAALNHRLHTLSDASGILLNAEICHL